MTPERIRASVDGYVAAWNETDAEKRRAFLRDACAESFVLVTSGRRAEGRAGLEAMIVEFQQRMPKSFVTLTRGVDIQGHLVRFTGTVSGPRFPTPVENMDACEVDDDGRLLRILTFVGASLPA